ncbi:MAG: T9SS type A sorting domain-containing protein [Bacteroidia bacterium]
MLKRKSLQTQSSRIKMLIAILFSGLLMLSASTRLKAQTFNPYSYYTFDGTNPIADDMGTGNLNASYYSSTYTVNNNAPNVGAGKYLTLSATTNIIIGSQFAPDTGLTVEFLFRPGLQLEAANVMWSQNGCFGIGIGFPYINFNTEAKTNSGNVIVDDLLRIDLTDIGRKTFGYYVDGNWHHLVFKMNPKTGVKQVWVDGECPAGFSKTVTPNCHFAPGTWNGIFLNNNTSYTKYIGDIDELAFYKYDLHPNMIYKHYQNFLAHNHYNFGWTTVAPPPASPVTGTLDMSEFPPGFTTPTVSQMDQLKSFPSARMRPGHTLLRNGTIISFSYLGGYKWPGVSDATAIANSVEIQRQLMNNFNYSIMVSGATTEYPYFGNVNSFSGAWIQLANQNPSISTVINTAWPHINPMNAGYKSGETYTTCNCLPNSSYLQNALGQFVDLGGNANGDKILAPDAPLDSIIQDGLTQKWYFQKLFQNLTRPLNSIFDECENVPNYRTSFAGPSLDVSVTAQKVASGLDWYTYFGKKYANFCTTYRDNFLNLPQLANTSYQMYETEGHVDYRQKYSEMRVINTLRNGNHYPVASMYTRFPWNWRYNSSAWNGWQWYIESRMNEIAAGDQYCSPAPAAGWDIAEENNIRPAQWLGFNKALAMAGAEFFYPAYFVLGTTALQNPANYVWQVTTPGYVQGITSRYEDLFKNGYVMSGDLPIVPSAPTGQMGFSFKSGDLRKLIVVRKHNTLNKYAITGTIQPNSNIQGNAELEGPAQITLAGQIVKFKVRRQGSTYIYDKTPASGPVFYMLDGWHETAHPYKWTKDFYFEGELFDNNNTNLVIKTEVPTGTPAGDYTNFTSYIGFNAATTATYNFTVRGNTPLTYYFWIRARAITSNSSVTARLDNGTVITINNIKPGWNWYRVNAATNQPIVYSNLSVGNHYIDVSSLNTNLEIDQVVLTTQSGNIFGVVIPPVSTIEKTLTANGPISFCAGNQVTLTCDTGVTYLWNTGATTQSIVVTNSGSYFATVTGAGAIVVNTDTMLVTRWGLPGATYTASGSLNICAPATSVIVTVDHAYTYLWSNGVTTQSVVLSTAGTYTATATSKKGCISVSVPIIVTTNCGGASCTKPTNGNVTNITATDANVSWSSPTNPTEFISTWISPWGFVRTTTVPGTARTSIVDQLKAGRTYKWFVQANCNGTLSLVSDTVTFTSALRLMDNAPADESISLSPNPANGMSYLTFTGAAEGKYSVGIMNVAGQQIQLIEGTAFDGLNTVNIDASTLPPGVYIVKLIMNNSVNNLRLIKQ